MFSAIVCAWNKTTTNKKPWKRLQVLIAARSLKKTFLLYVLQSCYTTAKKCVTTYNKCLCLHNILYWIQYSKSKIAENKQAILRMNCCMYFHKKFQNNTDAQKFNIGYTKIIHCLPKFPLLCSLIFLLKYILQFVCKKEVYLIWIWMLSVTFLA